MANCEFHSNTSTTPVLKKIFDGYADQTITEEQLRRVAGPVEAMIREGKFDRASHLIRLIRPFVLVAAVVAVFAVLNQPLPDSKDNITEEYVMIQEQGVPLGAAVRINKLSGRVYHKEVSVQGAEVSLIDADSMEAVDMALTDEWGAYSFQGFSDGEYILGVVLPEGGLNKSGDIPEGGELRFVFGKDGETAAENVDIRL